jgi:hypothetical protein
MKSYETESYRDSANVSFWLAEVVTTLMEVMGLLDNYS